MMAGLITGDFGLTADLDVQRQFFHDHVASWARHFFTDLEGAKSSVLYGALGTVGKAFIDIEEVAFTMD
jgi:TorA maturation chaperone TorD